MSEKILQLAKKLEEIVPALALNLATQSAKSTCFFCLHQPDVPEDLL